MYSQVILSNLLLPCLGGSLSGLAKLEACPLLIKANIQMQSHRDFTKVTLSLKEAYGIQISPVHGPFQKRESLLARARMFESLMAQGAKFEQSIGKLQSDVT